MKCIICKEKYDKNYILIDDYENGICDDCSTKIQDEEIEYWEKHNRPKYFKLNKENPLYSGLVFAGIGNPPVMVVNLKTGDYLVPPKRLGVIL